jgi:hypothetical protein
LDNVFKEENKNSIELSKFLPSQVYIHSRPMFYSEKDMRFVEESIHTIQDSVYPRRNNLCNLLVIGILIGDIDAGNQDVQSEICIVYSVMSP